MLYEIIEIIFRQLLRTISVMITGNIAYESNFAACNY